MKKHFGCVIFAIITIFLVFSNVVYKDKKCSEDRSKQFVVVGGSTISVAITKLRRVLMIT